LSDWEERFLLRFSSIQPIIRRKAILTFSVVFLVCGLLLISLGINLLFREQVDESKIFVGVDVGFGNEEDVIKVADAVAGYANLIVIGSLNVTQNTTALTRVCNYLFHKGFYFIIYVGFADNEYLPPRGPDPQFFNKTAYMWGDKFLGAYFFDEVGGKQIDRAHPVVIQARSHSEAAEIFVSGLIGPLNISVTWYDPPHPKLFVSDYALYWYDYLGGYDVVFGQFVGNQSRQLTVALCRGAAKTFSKEWGAIITWKYEQPPYLEEAEQLYNDMILAYQNGAKYIVVFNSAGNNTSLTEYGILAPEHFDAMEKFWKYIKTNSHMKAYQADTAYVLPKDYGYGFRGPNDTIWGLWPADVLSPKVWSETKSLIDKYGINLDIVYETRIDGQRINLPYDKLIFWNGTTIEK
jgi:uncharacterized membrane protein